MSYVRIILMHLLKQSAELLVVVVQQLVVVQGRDQDLVQDVNVQQELQMKLLALHVLQQLLLKHQAGVIIQVIGFLINVMLLIIVLVQLHFLHVMLEPVFVVAEVLLAGGKELFVVIIHHAFYVVMIVVCLHMNIFAAQQAVLELAHLLMDFKVGERVILLFIAR